MKQCFPLSLSQSLTFLTIFCPTYYLLLLYLWDLCSPHIQLYFLSYRNKRNKETFQFCLFSLFLIVFSCEDNFDNWSCLLTRTLELASSNLDRRVHRFYLRPSSRSTSRTCKRTERCRCGRSHSNAQVSDRTTKY